MGTVKMYEALGKRALITRASAGAIKQALAEASEDEELVLDFSGVEAVTPSFVDEALAVIEDGLGRIRKPPRLIFLHPPTRLSSKFAAVGRARQLDITEAVDGSWIVSSAPERSGG